MSSFEKDKPPPVANVTVNLEALNEVGILENNLNVLVEPSHGLSKRSLLRKSNHRLGNVRPNGEAMLNTPEQIDLVRLARLAQDLFRFTALLSWEDGVGF